ncbi:uncharacterized protein TNCV_3712981 [Trichonephila clavipes]|nr:uncharacterized protein TNCV_3712981 [Trichonephila clavipes]
MTSETVEVARIALRLPPFWKSNVRLWIAQCDHAFTFSGISSDDTKYSALVANLNAETLSYLLDIVLSPPNSDKYHTLSQRLITQFSDSETQKIKKLLTDLQLGQCFSNCGARPWGRDNPSRGRETLENIKGLKNYFLE